MSLYSHQLDINRHTRFLAEGRQDPITKETLKAGDHIAICAGCKTAYLVNSWNYHGGCVCGTTETLGHVPYSEERLDITQSPPRLKLRLPFEAPLDNPLSLLAARKRRNKFIAAGVVISVLIFVIVSIIVSNVGRKNAKHSQSTVSKLNLEENKKDEEFPPEYKPSFSVTIDSSPSGATAFIDNKQVGITPLSIKLEKGSHGIYFKKEGYTFPGEILEVEKGVNPSIYKLKEE